MGRQARHDILFEPVQIGPKMLRNRFFQVPYGTSLGRKPWSWAAHREVKVEGGWAAVCTDWTTVSPDSDENPVVAGELLGDEDLGGLALMVNAAHKHGALAGIELAHSGIHASVAESRWPLITSSQIYGSRRTYAHGAKAMELEDIRRVQADWVRAATQAQSIGFDIIYVLGSHLPMQFLSSHYNKRTDKYGGSLENRARFWLEVLEMVRHAVSEKCAVACRMYVEGFGIGTSLDESLAFIRLADHFVDLWDVNVGSITEEWRDVPTSRFASEGSHLEWTGHVREATAKPIVGVGRFTNPDTMAKVIRSGVLDLIGAARPSIADPFLPKKIEEGRYDEIRECAGANVCVMFDMRGHIGCIQNPTAGEEYRRGWHPEHFEPAKNADRDVLVIGAGPAGMECAIVLAKRGMKRIHLVEAEPEIGGSLRWISRLPGLGEWGRILNWRQIQLNRLRNVEIIKGLALDAQAAREYGAEIIICATGATWSTNGMNRVTQQPIPGADASLPHVLTPEQIMLGTKVPSGERVVIYDCEGYITAASLADKLALEGFKVDLVSCFEQIAPVCDLTMEGEPLRKRLHHAGVGLYPGVTLTEVRPGSVLGTNTFAEPVEMSADAVVLVTQRVSNEGLYLELKNDGAALTAAGIEAVYRVGDCVAPREMADAIFDGHRLGREIDSSNPAVPVPYRRERIVVPKLTSVPTATSA